MTYVMSHSWAVGESQSSSWPPGEGRTMKSTVSAEWENERGGETKRGVSGYNQRRPPSTPFPQPKPVQVSQISVLQWMRACAHFLTQNVDLFKHKITHLFFKKCHTWFRTKTPMHPPCILPSQVEVFADKQTLFETQTANTSTMRRRRTL